MKKENETFHPTESLKITFCGGTGMVTGANFLVTYSDQQFLIDCGMMQGVHLSELRNYDPFPYDPSKISALLVTHAHEDHIGRIPKLVRDGFRGTIYSTQPTKEIAEVMLADAVNIIAHDAKEVGRDPFFSASDVDQAMQLWKVIPYHDHFEFLSGISFTMYDAGHVLGSAMFLVQIKDTKILFTGDLGNEPSPLLRDIEHVAGVDYVVMESVYGDRNHQQREERTQDLERALEDTARRQGTLLIPVFSLERTQEILAEINMLVESGRVPEIPVYLDSPLAVKVTEIYKNSTEFFNAHIRKIINHGDNVFEFPGLQFTRSVEESKSINEAPSPKVILAGSGMMNGGRILHHAERYLPLETTILLFVGFQSAGTLGRVIQDGTKKVKIFRWDIDVQAEIRTISAYSGHADRDALVQFVTDLGESVQRVFCVMGEPQSAQFLAQRLRDYVGVHASAPEEGESVDLPVK